LTHSLALPSWQNKSEECEAAAFAWTGWREPALCANDDVLAVFDGSIFNAEELDARASANPAELLVDEYRKKGFRATIEAINGDFACALFDSTAGELWLARDRVGHRPLYFAKNGRTFAFASLPAALVGLPGISRAINRRYAAVFGGSHYRYIDNRPDESPFRDILQLPPATLLRVRDGAVHAERYWDLHEHEDCRGSEQDLAQQYRDLLLDSVRRRMAATSTHAFTLSGGLDSSSVAAAAVTISGAKQHAFSTVYSDTTYDESEDIRTFLKDKISQWHAVPVENFDLLGTVERMVAHHNEPVATVTWLSHFLLCEEVSRAGFRTLFGGLGGDELNAGEYEYFFYYFADLNRAGKNGVLAHEVDCWARHHDHPIYRKDRAVADAMVQRTTDPVQEGIIRADRARMTRYFPAISQDFFDLGDFEPVMDHPFNSYLRNRTYQDMFRETAPCCLRAEDRNCSSFGLDHVDPFFDHRLIEFMFRVPGAMKIRDGVTKRLLRDAMTGILPEETRTRIKKTGWNAPAHVWFTGHGRDQMRDLVASRTFRERGIYVVPEVERILNDHERIVASGAARENHMMFLWQLMNLEAWLRWCDALPQAGAADRMAS
jgi:asparagine synthase (glutamine-hydrolysing)